MSTTEPTFPVLLQQFFMQRLMQRKNVSPHTLCSYRDTFRLLLRFAMKKLHATPEQLTIEQIDAPFVTTFLNDLENSRGVYRHFWQQNQGDPRYNFTARRLQRKKECSLLIPPGQLAIHAALDLHSRWIWEAVLRMTVVQQILTGERQLQARAHVPR